MLTSLHQAIKGMDSSMKVNQSYLPQNVSIREEPIRETPLIPKPKQHSRQSKHKPKLDQKINAKGLLKIPSGVTL